MAQLVGGGLQDLVVGFEGEPITSDPVLPGQVGSRHVRNTELASRLRLDQPDHRRLGGIVVLARADELDRRRSPHQVGGVRGEVGRVVGQQHLAHLRRRPLHLGGEIVDPEPVRVILQRIQQARQLGHTVDEDRHQTPSPATARNAVIISSALVEGPINRTRTPSSYRRLRNAARCVTGTRKITSSSSRSCSTAPVSVLDFLDMSSR